jgi:uncharacterized protein (DUF427 family)
MTPGSHHPITIEPARTRWRALFHGHVIADSANAMVLQEGAMSPVVYFPREDVAMEYMGRTDKQTHCPHKGQAAYYTLRMESEIADNAVWTYEDPIEGSRTIAGLLAFDPTVVEVYPVDDAVVNPKGREDASDRREVDEIVQHTDSGSGATQREPWAPNVSGPEGGLR